MALDDKDVIDAGQGKPMDYLTVAGMLLLLLVANGTPVILEYLFDKRLRHPVDGGARFVDGKPLLGTSKTWRGLLGAILVTPLVAQSVGLGAQTGLIVAVAAMLGDLASSFTKRRMDIPPSGMALGLDQIPEALLPLIAMRSVIDLSVGEIVFLVAAFTLLELLLSRILFRLRIRKRPY
ncbi:MAG: CDP-archaeol synthase [Pseudomonadota bacterium]|nr:CDP-archaeol synthase [Pseudomonadota bacterium]